jgi:dipeptidyl aminopeptidase/acylaminoacyl peptidase
MKLLEHLAHGQLTLINVYDGKETKIGFPGMIRSVSMAPGEEQFRVTTLKKPFSYYVPLARFGSQEGLWNLEGKCLHTLADRNLRDSEPQPPSPTTLAAGQQRPTGQTRTTGPARAPGQPPTPTQTPGPDPDPDPNPGDSPRGPQSADPDGKRALGWRPDGAGLSFLQLEPAKKDAKEPRKDRVMLWLPPYKDDNVKVVYETPNRISSLQYSDDCQLLFLTWTAGNERQIVAVDLADPATPYVIQKSSTRGGSEPERPTGDTTTQPNGGAEEAQPDDDNDEQQVPGRRFGGGGIGAASRLLTRPSRGSVEVVRISSTGDVYLTGTERSRGESQQFSRPYIDKVNIKTGQKARVFEGKGDTFETIDAVDGDDIKLVFTSRQKQDIVPDTYLNDLASGKDKKLTNNVNHSPWYGQLKIQRFQVTRVDGFKFWVRVTTPPNTSGKLPALFWIYPREYTDQAAYDRSTGGRNQAATTRFSTPGPRSMTLLTLLGYAVVEPDVPIVGPAGRMNDNYIPDLRNSLWAVIDDLDKRGIIDRDRLAIGGHSYGAFSTANALAHTPFFKAGIAGDGNYNRTLTPMTFQTERRQMWDARETYLEMSPMLWANRVNGALLMYHGMDDANTGTNPINAEYLFMALDGLGKPAALYMYPHEGHGPLAKETTLDLWARWVAWLDKYVKSQNKEPKAVALEKGGSQ